MEKQREGEGERGGREEGIQRGREGERGGEGKRNGELQPLVYNVHNNHNIKNIGVDESR